MRKLLELLARETFSCPELGDELEQVLKEKCGVKLPPKESKSGTTRNFCERVKKARLGAPQLLAILEHYGNLLNVLVNSAPEGGQLRTKAERMHNVWRQYHALASLSKQSEGLDHRRGMAG